MNNFLLGVDRLRRLYDLKIYGLHQGEFEFHSGTLSQVLKAYYHFLENHILYCFNLEVHNAND